jgi:hypothetical protein
MVGVLLSDVKGLAEFAAQQVEPVAGRKARFSVRASVSYKFKAPNVKGSAEGPSPLVGLLKYNWRPDPLDGCTGKAIAGLLCELQSTPAATAAQLGFGLSDAALFAWELTPFSFVFDWFIDVGTWIEELSSLQGIKVLAGFTSTEEVLRGDMQASLESPSWTLDGVFPITKYQFRRYTRDPWSGSGPTIRIHVGDALSARRLVSAAALWRQQCRGDRVPGQYRP